MKQCNEEGNHQGYCCCNCRWQRPIGAHPWNKDEAFKGRISNVIGFGCTVPDMPNITFSDRGHGMCEVWEKKGD